MVHSLMIAEDEGATGRRQMRSFFSNTFVLFLTAFNMVIASAYIAEKLDMILSGRNIHLYLDNAETHRRMADKEVGEITDCPGPL